MPTNDDEVEHLDVVVVGAGLSGIAAGHHLRTTCPWARYAVIEARDALGGTWDLFRYPGIRSDSDMHTFGFPWRPWTRPDTIAAGGDILDYLRETAAEEGVDRHIRFGRRVAAADFSVDEARWHLTIEDVHTGALEQLTCGFLIGCTGYYRYDHGHTPEFAGIDEFAGQLVHPQHWPEDLDVSGQRVVIIGSGATAVTLLPSLADDAEHVTMLQRSPTYVATVPRRSPLAKLLRRVLPSRWSEPTIRWSHALLTQGSYRFCRRFPNAARRALRRGVEAQLPDGYDVDTHFSPKYDPWDQRLCADPEGEFFAAIRQGRATVVTDTIDRFTPSGVRLASGTELAADVVVTATGLELLYLGGIDLSVDGEKVDVSERLVYKGTMLQDVPNLAVVIGYTNASWTLRADLSCDHTARLIATMRERGETRVTPRVGDAAAGSEPSFGLSAGYVQRAADRLPKQGTRDPWIVRQSYLADHRAMARRPLLEDELELSSTRTSR